MADEPTASSAATRRRPTSARLVEPVPTRDVALHEEDGVFRMVAANPGPMTYHGTNTWFIETEAGLVLLDPGPDDDTHLAALVAAAAGRVTHLLVSHSHPDHIGLARKLSAALGLPIHGHPGIAEAGVPADVTVVDGQVVAGLTAVWTPGHARDHLCFSRADGLMFTADHIMGWSTSVVPPPPYGDAGDYLRSLARVRDGNYRKLMCGHGPVVTDPAMLINALTIQRTRRERQIASMLADAPASLDALMEALYPGIQAGLGFAARANIQGHLAKLVADGVAVQREGVWARASGRSD